MIEFAILILMAIVVTMVKLYGVGLYMFDRWEAGRRAERFFKGLKND